MVVLHNIRMTTEHTTLVHQIVFVKDSIVKRYYLLKLLELNSNEQLWKYNDFFFLQPYDQINLVKFKFRGLFAVSISDKFSPYSASKIW